MLNIRTNRTVLLMLTCVAILAVAFAWYFRESPRTQAIIQLAAVPFVLMGFSRLQILETRLPRWIVLFSLVGTLGGAIVTYSHVDLARGAFVVARFADDELETTTKITRDRIRRVVGWNGVTLVGSHYETIVTSSEAQSLLRDNQNLSGVIWGTPRWINVALHQTPDIDIDHLSHGRMELQKRLGRRIPNLRLITSIPTVGMSGSSEYPTVDFLGRLVGTWRDFYTVLSLPDSSPDFEMDLREMAGVKGAWTSFSHRALPMWMTGTYHLARSLANREMDMGDVSCALGSFEAASAQMRSGNNLELSVSILNNQAVAVIVQSMMTGDPKEARREAKGILYRALSLGKINATEDAQIPALRTVQQNLGVLIAKSAMTKKGSQRSIKVLKKSTLP